MLLLCIPLIRTMNRMEKGKSKGWQGSSTKTSTNSICLLWPAKSDLSASSSNRRPFYWRIESDLAFESQVSWLVSHSNTSHWTFCRRWLCASSYPLMLCTSHGHHDHNSKNTTSGPLGHLFHFVVSWHDEILRGRKCKALQLLYLLNLPKSSPRLSISVFSPRFLTWAQLAKAKAARSTREPQIAFQARPKAFLEGRAFVQVQPLTTLVGEMIRWESWTSHKLTALQCLQILKSCCERSHLSRERKPQKCGGELGWTHQVIKIDRVLLSSQCDAQHPFWALPKAVLCYELCCLLLRSQSHKGNHWHQGSWQVLTRRGYSSCLLLSPRKAMFLLFPLTSPHSFIHLLR